MSQYGYPYGASEGYYDGSHHFPPYNGNAPYSPASSQLRPEESSRHAYDYNRNMIPGLGLGYSQPQAVPLGVTEQTYQPPVTPAAPLQPSSREDAGNRGHVPTIENELDEGAVGDNELEEGELSEGELEDIYEPQSLPPKPPHAASGNTYNSNVTTSFFRHESSTTNHPNRYPSALDHNGAYVPYVPPPNEPLPQPRSFHGEKPLPSNPSVLRSNSSISPSSFSKPSDAVPSTSVAEAKKHAQDAILRLWPLNVRFKDYINEGIDRRVLQRLFEDLGLEADISPMESPSSAAMSIDMASQTPKETSVSSHSNERQETQGVEQATDATAQVPVQSLAENQTAAPVDARAGAPIDGLIEALAEAPAKVAIEASTKTATDTPAELPMSNPAESRKDRIARLLAAKIQKPAPPPSAPKPETLATLSSASKKPQSEKSKLLQQKMEALRKARELTKANGTSSAGTPAGTPPLVPATIPSQATSSPASQGPPLHKSASMPSGTPGPRDLDSSPNPTVMPTGPPKRPAASDLIDSSHSTAKRPFGQTRDSKPFLIDVSDDDNDEAMDLDSPELESASLNRPSSPFKIPSLHSFAATPAGAIPAVPRQLSLPAPAGTPQSGNSSVPSSDHLKSMDKKIELMKQRIAEAEARRAKLSGTGSPSGLQMSEQPGQSGTGPNGDVLQHSPAPAPSTPASEPNFAVSPAQSPADLPSQKLPKLSELKGVRKASSSRSRAASERLPLIEANRKQKLLKLEALRSQVARIEKEIKDHMQEEERLRLEALEGDSDGEEKPESRPQSRPQSEAAASDGAAPMETDSESSADEAEAEDAGSAGFAQPNNGYPPETTLPTQQPHHNTDPIAELVTATAAKEDTNEQALPTTDMVPEPVAQSQPTQDDVMADSNPLSRDESAEASEDYEPPEAAESSPGDTSSFSPAPVVDRTVPAVDDEAQDVSAATPITKPISTGRQDSPSAATREERASQPPTKPEQPSSGFTPYESPLQYFRAFRFHPLYQETVAGGLRSLTYSNKIDVKQQMCPDQLTGNVCPRGSACEFQHFEMLEVPDDQLLVQLGAYEGDRKGEYIAGLRQLLTDFRAKKIKDFKTISQGIIDYRAQFRADKTKILPLGNVSL